MVCVTGALDLFGESPPARSVRIAQGAFEASRETELGRRVYEVLRYRALALVRAGCAPVLVSSLMEWSETTQHLVLAGEWAGALAAALMEQEPDLRGKLVRDAA